MNPIQMLLSVLALIVPNAGTTPAELIQLFNSSSFDQSPLGTAWHGLCQWAANRSDVETLYRLRRLRNAALTGAPDAVIVRDSNRLRARLVDLCITDPQLSAQIAPLFRAMQVPLLNLQPLPYAAVMLYVLTHSVVEVVAEEAINRGWTTARDAEAMRRRMHSLLDAMFCGLSSDWVYFDELESFVCFVAAEFGGP